MRSSGEPRPVDNADERQQMAGRIAELMPIDRFLRGPADHVQVHSDADPMGRPPRATIGLALGSGAARGWAHIGVMRALEEADILPDIVAGTSIGALVGGCYLGGKLDELEHFARRLTKRRVFSLLDFTFSGSGLISGQRLYSRLGKGLGDIRIEQLERRFIAVATELGSGHEIWLSRGSLSEAMHASYALPGIFRPVRSNGRWLVDGALVNPVPVSVCRAFGARVVIAVNLHTDVFGRGTVFLHDAGEDEGADTDNATAANGADGIFQDTRKLLWRQFIGRGDDAPGITNVMFDAFNIIQDRITRSRLAGDPPDVTIGPKLAPIGLFEFHRAEEAMNAGYQTTVRMIDEIRDFVRALA